MKFGHDSQVNAALLGGSALLLWGLWAVYWPLVPIAFGAAALGIGLWATLKTR